MAVLTAVSTVVVTAVSAIKTAVSTAVGTAVAVETAVVVTVVRRGRLVGRTRLDGRGRLEHAISLQRLPTKLKWIARARDAGISIQQLYNNYTTTIQQLHTTIHFPAVLQEKSLAEEKNA